MLNATRGLATAAVAAIGASSLPMVASAQPPGFYLVGESAGTNQSYVFDFTADGSLAVGGTSRTSGPDPIERGFRWTPDQGRVDATDVGLRLFHRFTGISSNGSVIVGYHYNTFPGTDGRAFVLRTGLPLQSIPTLSTYPRCVVPPCVSGDGAIVAGTCYLSTSIPVGARGFRWTAATGTQEIPPARLGDSYCVVSAISRDGTTIVGKSSNQAAGTEDAFVWRASTGTMLLPTPLGGSDALGVNADGTVIVGHYYTPEGERAVYWDGQLQLHDLGSASGSQEQLARCVSADGSIIGGEAGGESSTSREAFIWTEQTGMVWARDYFAERGATVPVGYRTYQCMTASDDGRRFGVRVRPGTQAANISAVVILGPKCPADFNRDGGVDGGDVEAFFQPWSNGLDSADVNEDGGVDGADVEFFFASWEAGGC